MDTALRSVAFAACSYNNNNRRRRSESQSLSFNSPKLTMSPCEPLTLTTVQDDTTVFDYHCLDQQLLNTVAYDALVWSSLHGLLVGDKSIQGSGSVPGVGLVHAPLALLPTPYPEKQWREACELAPIFNELVDRVSMDATFLQESLSRSQTNVTLQILRSCLLLFCNACK